MILYDIMRCKVIYFTESSVFDVCKKLALSVSA